VGATTMWALSLNLLPFPFFHLCNLRNLWTT
jgi:hypothetical protein